MPERDVRLPHTGPPWVGRALTAREREVIAVLVELHGDHALAGKRLGITYNTVKNLQYIVGRKLGVGAGEGLWGIAHALGFITVTRVTGAEDDARAALLRAEEAIETALEAIDEAADGGGIEPPRA